MLLCTILKVIGLVLLFLLLLILLLLELVLLTPIRYAGTGHKGEKKKDYAAHVDVSWFLHLVQLHAGLTPAGLACDLRILWFHPIDSRPPDTPPANASDGNSSQSEEKPSTEGSAAHASDETLSRGEEAASSDEAVVHSSDEASSRREATTAPDDTVVKDSDEAPSENEAVASPDDTAVDASDGFALQDEHTDVELKQPPEDEKILKESVNVPESKAEASERAAAQTAEVDSIELKSSTEPAVQTEEKLTSEEVPGSVETEDTSADIDQESETKRTSPAAEAPKKKKRKKSSFADRIKRICEKASSLREAVEDEENQKAFRLLISRVKYLLHHLRFRKFEGRLRFGFDDPAMMGRILGVLSLFYPLYGESFTLTPVFDHAVLEGEIALKGHVRLIHILIAAIQLLMNKKIRGLVLDHI